MGSTARGARRGRATRTLGAAALATVAVLSTLAVAAPASAAAPPTLWVDATLIDFGPVTIGSTSPTQTVTVTNIGPGTASGLAISTPTSAQYVRTATTCGTSLAQGASCTATFAYQPTQRTQVSASVAFSATGGTSALVEMTGTPDTTAPSFRVTATGIDFGPVAVGSASPTKAIQITNQSGAATALTVAGTAASGPFSYTSTTCPAPPATLGNGGSCTISYKFVPTAAGAASGAAPLTITKSGGSTEDHPLAFRGRGGTAGAPVVTISPFRLDFGRVAAGTTATEQSVAITNTSGATLSTTGLAGGGAGNFGGFYSCTPTLAPGASCTLTYAANPTTVGLLQGRTGGTFGTTGHPSVDFDLELTAYGTGSSARPTVSPIRVVLGPSAIGTPTAAKVVTLRNTGTATLTGISITALDPTVPQIALTTTTCGATLTAGSTCTFSVRSTPTTDEATFAQFQVATSKGNSTVGFQAGPVQTVHENFLLKAYIDFLDRYPTTTELAAGRAAIDAGTTSRRVYVTNLANSDEWIQTIVQGLYQSTLGRNGDAGGVAFWVGRLRSGKNTVAQVAAQFYASNEYFTHIGGGTNTTWVTDLYNKLLHRSPDTGGLSYWVGQTVAHGRADVAGRMFQSAESRRGRVIDLYEDLLARAPDPAGRDYWAGKIEKQGDIALAIELASSTEYLRLSQRYSGGAG